MSRLDPPVDALWQLTAAEILLLLKDNRVTVEEYAKSLLSRIDQQDTTTKAWIYLNHELVLTRARALDSIPREERGLLHGVAIGVKDVLLTADMPTQYNSPICFTNDASTVDASCVKALRAAGALIFGKTTTTEFAATMQGNVNQNYTTNPHASDRTPGGSSSGSGAAVADFHVPVALGTQTGGSVIRPASFNGVWGMKGTWGVVSAEGMSQFSPTCDTIGVFARSAEDLELIYSVLRVGSEDTPKELREATIKGAKIGFCQTASWQKDAGEGLKSVWKMAMTLLSSEEARVEELVLSEEFSTISRWHADILAGEGRASFLGSYLVDKERLAPSLRDKVENGKQISRQILLEAYDGCARLRPLWDRIAHDYDVVITPSVPDEAPVGLDHTGSHSFNFMWTILHAPTVNVPGLFGENGLPIGLTVVGARHTDVETLNWAREIGKAFEKASR